MHCNNSPLLSCPVLETSAAALCGTTGKLLEEVDLWGFLVLDFFPLQQQGVWDIAMSKGKQKTKNKLDQTRNGKALPRAPWCCWLSSLGAAFSFFWGRNPFGQLSLGRFLLKWEATKSQTAKANPLQDET